ncbi:MAG: aminodeoxychorismate lyase [Clostridia bacterium]|nr:aminodeoxychorismate lyase [Clostridia bacterium]
MVLSGIVMIVLILNVQEYKRDIVGQLSSQPVKYTDDLPNINQVSPTQPIENIEHKQSESKDLAKEEHIEEPVEEELEPVTKVIYIPGNLTASQICIILEQEGIIEDAKEFSNYLIQNKKTTYLKDGTITLPTDASYEELMKQLLIK